MEEGATRETRGCKARRRRRGTAARSAALPSARSRRRRHSQRRSASCRRRTWSRSCLSRHGARVRVEPVQWQVQWQGGCAPDRRTRGVEAHVVGVGRVEGVARDARPVVEGVRAVDDGQQARAEGSLAEGGPPGGAWRSGRAARAEGGRRWGEGARARGGVGRRSHDQSSPWRAGPPTPKPDATARAHSGCGVSHGTYAPSRLPPSPRLR